MSPTFAYLFNSFLCVIPRRSWIWVHRVGTSFILGLLRLLVPIGMPKCGSVRGALRIVIVASNIGYSWNKRKLREWALCPQRKMEILPGTWATEASSQSGLVASRQTREPSLPRVWELASCSVGLPEPLGDEGCWSREGEPRGRCRLLCYSCW